MTFFYKSRPFIFAFLLFSVASSKHIIIYNEELLVAGTFLAFVIYIQSAFGNSISSSIDESRNSILQELQSLAIHKKSGAENLKGLHEKVPYIHKSLASIEQYIHACVSQIGNIATKSYNRLASQQIQLRCEQAKQSSQLLFTSYQQTMSDSFLPGILVQTQSSLNPNHQKKQSTGIQKNKKIQGIKTAKKGIALLQNTLI